MKESEFIRLQVNRTMALLENTITRYYDALYELRRLTLILFDAHTTDKGLVDDWFVQEGFGIDADEFWLSLPLLKSYRSGRVPKDVISHSWNPKLQDHHDARSRRCSLQNIGSYLHEIRP